MVHVDPQPIDATAPANYRQAFHDLAEAERRFAAAYAVLADESVALPLAAKTNREGLLAGLAGATFSLDDLVRRICDRAEAVLFLKDPLLRRLRPGSMAGRGRYHQ